MSTGLAQIQSGINAAVGAAYPTGWNLSAYPITLQNQPFTPPTDKAWCRFCIRFASSRNTSIDAKARRVSGIAWLQIFIPEAKGSIDAQKIGDELDRILGNKTIVASGETIRFQRAVTEYVGQTPEGWEQHRCTIDFIADALTP